MMMVLLGIIITVSIAFVRYMALRFRHIERQTLIEQGWMPNQGFEHLEEARFLARIKWMRNAYLISGLGIGALLGAATSFFAWEIWGMTGPFPVLFILILMGLGGAAGIIWFYRIEPEWQPEPTPSERIFVEHEG